MTIKKLGIRTTAIEAFRAALAARALDEPHPTLHAHLTQGQATELFATDNYGIIFIPTNDIHIDWTNEPAKSLRIQISNAKIPARATNITITIDQTHGILTVDGNAVGFAQITEGHSPLARSVAPENLPALAIAPPYGYDTLRAAAILRASGKTPPTRSEPIELPQAGIAFRWRFPTGGEYVLVSNRGEDHDVKRFKGILSVTRERSPF